MMTPVLASKPSISTSSLADSRAAAVTTAWIDCSKSVSVIFPKVGIKFPARPIRSSARRISGAKTTGMEKSRAGTELRTSHEKAGRSTKLVNRMRETTINMTPRNKTIAWVSRSHDRRAKKINVTSKMSMTLSQLSR